MNKYIVTAILLLASGQLFGMETADQNDDETHKEAIIRRGSELSRGIRDWDVNKIRDNVTPNNVNTFYQKVTRFGGVKKCTPAGIVMYNYLQQDRSEPSNVTDATVIEILEILKANGAELNQCAEIPSRKSPYYTSLFGILSNINNRNQINRVPLFQWCVDNNLTVAEMRYHETSNAPEYFSNLEELEKTFAANYATYQKRPTEDNAWRVNELADCLQVLGGCSQATSDKIDAFKKGCREEDRREKKATIIKRLGLGILGAALLGTSWYYKDHISNGLNSIFGALSSWTSRLFG